MRSRYRPKRVHAALPRAVDACARARLGGVALPRSSVSVTAIGLMPRGADRSGAVRRAVRSDRGRRLRFCWTVRISSTLPPLFISVRRVDLFAAQVAQSRLFVDDRRSDVLGVDARFWTVPASPDVSSVRRARAAGTSIVSCAACTAPAVRGFASSSDVRTPSFSRVTRARA